MMKETLTRLFKKPSRRLPDGVRAYAIGDVHGHLPRLLDLHAAIRAELTSHPVPEPVLLHIGDLIDRGPDSAGVLSLLCDGPPVPGLKTVNLIGNHESMLLDAMRDRDQAAGEHWVMHGGADTLASWGIAATTPVAEWEQRIPPAHLALLRSLDLHWQCGRYLFVHAGVRPGTPLDAQVVEDLLWIREPFLDCSGPMLPEAPDTIVVHGHSPRPRPEVRAHRINTDTGAGKGGRLTCAVLERDDVRFLQA